MPQYYLSNILSFHFKSSVLKQLFTTKSQADCILEAILQDIYCISFKIMMSLLMYTSHSSEGKANAFTKNSLIKYFYI